MAPLVKKIGGEFVMLYVGSSGTAYDLSPKRMPDKRVYRLGLARSSDGKQFVKHPEPVVELKDSKRSFLTPTILSNADGTLIKENGKYRMWFCSATLVAGGRAHAVQHAASEDGITWHKHPQNPVFKANPKRDWESHYVSSGTIMQVPDNSFRMWYFARKKPPFKNLYEAFGTATWQGPKNNSD